MKALMKNAKITRNEYILFCVLIIAFLLRVYNLNYNSPFLDEALYIVVGRSVLSGEWETLNPFSWVGGMPLFYPTLSAIFGFFGIVGARFFNVLLGTFSVFLVYLFTKNLLLSNKESENSLMGIFAAVFLAILAIPLYLSRIAIYDMLSFTLFLLGMVFLIKGFTLKKPKAWQQENIFGFASGAFFLSFLAKYITLILFPPILLLGYIYAWYRGGKIYTVFQQYFAAPVIILTTAYIIYNFQALWAFQTEQVSAPDQLTFSIFSSFIEYTLPVLLLAILGAIVLVVRKQILLPVVFILLAFVTPVVHAITNNSAASNQHAFLSLIFLVPLAAYFLFFLIEKQKMVGSLITLIIIVVTWIFSYGQIRSLETSWPNSNNAMAYLQKNTTHYEKILSSEDDITIIALPHLQNTNITGIYDFQYKSLSGDDAYVQAIEDGYFDYILLDEENTDGVKKAIKESLTNTYSQVYSKQPFHIYKRNKS